MIHPRDALRESALDDGLTRCEVAPVDHYAGNERFIGKAFALQQTYGAALDVTCDLEDGAAVGREDDQLTMVIDMIRGRKHQKGAVGVRVHPPGDSRTIAEVQRLVSAVGGTLRYITLPKVGTGAEVLSIVRAIEVAEQRAQVTAPIALHVLIESEHALRNLAEIAAVPRVRCLDFGIMDFVSSYGGVVPRAAMQSPLQFEHHLVVRAKVEIVAAAVLYGRAVAHNVTINVDTPAQAGSDARRAAHEFGFSRQWSIHPAQIEPIIEAFRPSVDDIALASEVLCRAQDCAWGPLRYQGTLFDRASYRTLWRTLRRAESSGAAIPQQVRERFFT